jgi:hypothetical protein
MSRRYLNDTAIDPRYHLAVAAWNGGDKRSGGRVAVAILADVAAGKQVVIRGGGLVNLVAMRDHLERHYPGEPPMGALKQALICEQEAKCHTPDDRDYDTDQLRRSMDTLILAGERVMALVCAENLDGHPDTVAAIDHLYAATEGARTLLRETTAAAR